METVNKNVLHPSRMLDQADISKLFKKENLGKSKGRKESNTILKYTKYLKTHFS